VPLAERKPIYQQTTLFNKLPLKENQEEVKHLDPTLLKKRQTNLLILSKAPIQLLILLKNLYLHTKSKLNSQVNQIFSRVKLLSPLILLRQEQNRTISQIRSIQKFTIPILLKVKLEEVMMESQALNQLLIFLDHLQK